MLSHQSFVRKYPAGHTLLAVVVLGAAISPSLGALTFDADPTVGSPGVQAGDGTWNTGNVNWWNSTTSTNVIWPAAPGAEVANFGGADGTYAITVGNSLTVRSISFLNSGYTLSAASAVTLGETSGSTGVVSVASGKSATLGANVTFDHGGSNTDLTGGGTLNIGGTVRSGGSFNAIRIQNGTTVDLKTGGSMYTTHENNSSIFVNSGLLKLSGGTLQLQNSATANDVNASNLYVGRGNGNTGTLTLDSGAVQIFRNHRSTAVIAERVSGKLIVGENSGGGATGIVNLNGGTLSIPGTRFNGGSGDLGPATDGSIVLTSGNSTNATVNFAGTDASVGATSVRGLRFFNTDGQTNATATANLTGGTLTTPVITTYATHGNGTTGTFNFDGGLLKANASNASFFGAAGTNLLDVTAVVKAGGARIDSNSFNIGVGQALTHQASLGATTLDGGLTKSGTGVLTLSGASTYTGVTTINAGQLALASGGSIVVDINDASNSRFEGAAANGLALDGALRVDVSDFSGETGAWQVVAASLGATYGDNFSVALRGAPDVVFAEASGVWTATDGSGRIWSFSESSGVLAVPEPATLSLLAAGALLSLRRRRA